MPVGELLFVLLAAACSVVASLFLRHGLMTVGGFSIGADGVAGLVFRLIKSYTFMVGMLLYGMAALSWFKMLSVSELSTTYPMFVGLTFSFVTLGAVVFFGESIGPAKLTGIIVILVGVVIIARSH